MADRLTRISDEQRAAREALLAMGQRRRDAGNATPMNVTGVELVTELHRLGFCITTTAEPGDASHLTLRSLAIAFVRAWETGYESGPHGNQYRQILITAMGDVLDRGPTHGYLSTACLHALIDDDAALHATCRVVCKYGGEMCLCPVCNHQTGDQPAEDPCMQHVGQIIYDGSAAAEPDCELCREASRRKLWQVHGFDDPLTEEADRG